MSEKRFTIDKDNRIFDNGGIMSKTEVVCLLNEQQSTIEQLQEENKELKHWKKRIIEYLSDWFNKTEYLTVLYKINEINNEIGLGSDE